MRSIQLIMFFLVLCAAFACNSSDSGSFGKVNTESIYLDYNISADEESENVLCMFKYRIGGPEGTALLLDPSDKVQLDGQIIKADSARFTGVYYEQVKNKKDFIGKHRIVLSTGDKEFSHEFEFKPFRLSEELPVRISRLPFSIQLADFPSKETAINIVMIDTAYATNDVNERVVIENGKLFITPAMLSQLKNGPINIQLTGEDQKVLRNSTKAGGRLTIRYGLKREFELGD